MVWFKKTSADSVTSGLIHRWTFSEGSGSTVGDSIGSADGSVNGMSWSADEKVDVYSGGFDGVDDYVIYPSGSGGEGLSNASWTFWYEPTDADNAGTTSTATIWAANEGNVFRFYHDGSIQKVAANIADSGGSWTSSPRPSTTFSDNTYIHVAVTFDGSTGALKLYIDGTEEDSLSTNISKTNNPGDQHIMGSGVYNGSTNNKHIQGNLDDCRIYDRTLSDSDVQTIYNNTK